jgi:hypothetical protein
MGTKKVLIGMAIGCAVLVVLAIVTAFIGYRLLIAPITSGRLKMPSSLKTPTVLVGSGLMTRDVLISDARLGKVTDIVRGELDPHPGMEIGIAGTEGAVFLDDSLKAKSTVQFSASNSHVDIVDVNGDHVCEFMNRGAWSSDASLIDHSGKTMWTYGGMPGVDDMCAGDIDGDGIRELAVGFNGDGGIRLLDKTAKMRWKQPGWNVWHVEMADTDGDGKLEIVHSDAGGEIVIRDAQGNLLRRGRPAAYFSHFSLCRWPGKKDRPYALLSEDDAIWLFDFDGKTVAQFKAPRAGSLGDARGLPVKLYRNKPECLAVVVEFENWDRSIIYVYDSKGTLLYQEILPEACASIGGITLDRSGAETILVGGNGRVWQYGVNH